MITGAVTPKREARIKITVDSPAGYEFMTEAIIDTGFNGFLTLRPEQISRLGLPRIGRGRALLANGSQAVFHIYEVRVQWNEQFLTVEVDAADSEPLVGMALLEGNDLDIEVRDGGRVMIG